MTPTEARKAICRAERVFLDTCRDVRKKCKHRWLAFNDIDGSIWQCAGCGKTLDNEPKARKK